ncbi:MAG TPA: hypothetical protein VHI13_09200 [Candidatus Kapabacteria bacterium]|nr:hypothetical protein [Candidatus Kapabacteria bacterium]
MALERTDILAALTHLLSPRTDVLAAWEAGSAAFSRADAWSDIDLSIIAEDGAVPDVAAVILEELRSLSPIEMQWVLPSPTWHGHYQAFYKLRDTNPFLLLDIVIMERSATGRFMETALHGTPHVAFDKEGLIRPEHLDHDAHMAKILARLDHLRSTVPLMRSLALKELERGRPIDAMAFYHSHTLRPLVELLRIRYSPARYNFGARYLHHDLPAEAAQRVERLFFVPDPASLRAAHREAWEWFAELAAAIDPEAVAARLREQDG